MKPDTWRVVEATAFEGWRNRLDFQWGPLCDYEIRHQGMMLFPQMRTCHSVHLTQVVQPGLLSSPRILWMNYGGKFPLAPRISLYLKQYSL